MCTISKKLNHFIPYISASFVFCLACNGQSTTTCPTCPATTACPIPTQNIQLSHLDHNARERLKAELLAEIKEEMRQQWLQEFEKSQKEKEKLTERVQVMEPTPTDVPQQPINAQKTVNPQKFEPLPPTQKIERDDGGMKILNHTFATQIVKRLPIDERDVFTIADASVFCYVEIASASEEDRTITIRFTHATGLAQSYTLPVSQSPAWRTWSKLNLTKSMTGTWLCEIFNEDDTLLASRSFLIVDD